MCIRDSPKVSNDKLEQKLHQRHFLLILYLYENYADSIKEIDKDFQEFFLSASETSEEIKELKQAIMAIRSDSSERTNYALYAEAMMLEIKLSKEEAISEYFRVTDEIRLIFDDKFIEYLKKLAKNHNLTAFRKENLQKLLNLRDNTSDQENELIQFLNTYN